MPKFVFTSPEGKKYTVSGPEGATKEQAFEMLQRQIGGAQPKVAEPKEESSTLSKIGEVAGNAAKGFASGFADVGDTILNTVKGMADGAVPRESLSFLPGGAPAPNTRNADRNASLEQFNDANKDSTAFSIGRVGGNVAATWPIGGALGQGAKALGAAPSVVNALATGGMKAGANPGALNMLTRMAGGATTGGVSAGLVDPNYAGFGAAVGGALPPALSGVGKVAQAAGGLVRPFYKGGQDAIKGNALREFATDPQSALQNLRNVREVIPGSVPTSVMASGDEGLAGLSRTLQSQSGQYAGELSARQAAQNAARTSAIEGVAGNTGKIKLAEEARDAATSMIRESVLDSAGKIPAAPVLSSIDDLLKNPSNAGKLSQQALNEFRGRISQFSPDGQIDSRALYAIRKDINDVLGGKLQGDAGNMKFASSQLIKVKELIDDAIDKSSRAVGAGNGKILAGSNAQNAGPRPTWKQYLQEYSDRSKPIEQMKALDDVLKRIQTGTVDKSGNAVLSAAKLNNLLKNDNKELAKLLSADQLDLLRRLAADMNASQLANNAGKAVGSNTVQNLSQGNLLKDILGKSIGGSTAATSTLGRVMQLPYGTANQQIMEGVGNALLDPQEMMRLLQTPQGNKLMQALSNNAQIGYKAAPVLTAQ